MADEPFLTIRASGPAARDGRLPLAELGRIAGEFQAVIERIAVALAGGRPVAGPRPREIVDAVALELRAVSRGSAVLEVDRLAAPSRHDPLVQTLATLQEGFSGLAEGQLPAGFTQPVLDGLLRLGAGVVDGTLASIEVGWGKRTAIRIDQSTHHQLRQARNRVRVADATIVGRLQMGDFAATARRCRIDTFTGSVTCTFGAELAAAVRAALGELVTASGRAEYVGGDLTIRAFELRAIETVPSAKHRTLAELAEDQGVRPIRSVADLASSEPPLSDEEFAAFLHEALDARGGRPTE